MDLYLEVYCLSTVANILNLQEIKRPSNQNWEVHQH